MGQPLGGKERGFVCVRFERVYISCILLVLKSRPMKGLISLMLCAVSFVITAQVTYPYNPDGDSDGLISLSDLQDLLSLYGATGQPLEIQIGDESLTDFLAVLMTNQIAMQEVIAAQQDYIESLQQHVSVENGRVLIEGADLQIVSGSGQTDGEVNGKGNLIIGYNEDFYNLRTGSHNLVLGSYHNYSSFGGMVCGFENSISGEFSSVTGGSFNSATGVSCAILGGQHNTATGNMTSVSGGSTNHCSGNSTSVLGGYQNSASENLSTVVGDSTRSYLESSTEGNAIE